MSYMSCNTNHPPVPPSDSIEIVSDIGDTLLSIEVGKIAENLKKAGVTEVDIEPDFSGDEIRIRPVGGNSDDVRQALGILRDRLAKDGVQAAELPLFSCNNHSGPWYLSINKHDIER